MNSGAYASLFFCGSLHKISEKLELCYHDKINLEAITLKSGSKKEISTCN